MTIKVSYTHIMPLQWNDHRYGSSNDVTDSMLFW